MLDVEMAGGCPTEDTVLDWLAGQLPPELAAEVDEHVDACAECRELVRALVRSQQADTDIGMSPTHVDGAQDRRADSAVLARGTTVGRYLVVDVLGAGGMGVVYTAYDPELDRKVAVKLLRPEHADAEASARLLREGRAIARLSHPNVVTVHDVGTHEGSVFFAMELVDARSLDRWMETRHGWREVISVFLQAGAGLVAAHAAHIVHRDFKPGNVLLGSDGRARVSDFGLARVSGADAPSSRPSLRDLVDSNDLTLSLTKTGAVMGTPGYMAPEQLVAGIIDARSDQFSFAVALYEALYGERPFAGLTMGEIALAISEERVRPPSPGSDVPVRVREIVVRGLRARPEQRYPDLAAMLADLKRELRRGAKLGRTLSIAAVAVCAVAIGVVGVLALDRSAETSCDSAGGGFDAVWNLPHRIAIVRAFGQIHQPYAADAVAAIAHALDSYGNSWRAQSIDACRAADERHEQTEEQHGLRTLCLDERATDARALVELFTRADADVVRHAAAAAEHLTPPASCGDLRALSATVRAPTDAATRAKADALRERLARARAMSEAGQYQAAYDAVKPLVDEAEALAYKPLLAQVLLLAGFAASHAAEPKVGEALLVRAVQAAVAGRDDRTEVEAWVTEAGIVAIDLRRYDDASTLADHAQAALERAGGDPLLQTRIDSTRAVILQLQGKYAPAHALFVRTIAARRRLEPAGSLDFARMLTNFASALEQLWKYDDALAAAQEALAIEARTLGPTHPTVADTLITLAHIKGLLGDLATAETLNRRALAIREQALGADHPDVAAAMTALGEVLRAMDRPADASALALRALDISRRHFGPDDANSIFASHQLAEDYIDLARYADAAALLEHALPSWIKAAGKDHPSLALIYGSLARAYAGEARWHDAHTAEERAMSLDIATYGSDHEKIVIDLVERARIYAAEGKMDEAVPPIRSAVAIQEKLRGADHLDPSLLGWLASALLPDHKPAEARDVALRALALIERDHGPGAPTSIEPLSLLARALNDLAQYDEAIATYERALALDGAQTHGDLYPRDEFELGAILWDRKHDRARARKLIDDARVRCDRAAACDRYDVIQAWLRAHRT